MKLAEEFGRIRALGRRVYSVFPFLLVFSAIACHTSGDRSETGAVVPQRAALAAETAEAVGAALRPLVASGKVASLRWPDFRDVSGDTTKFYVGRGYAPAWVDGTGPTAQAKLVVSILQEAAQKGLNAEDYDASRWQSREEVFAGKPTPDEIARFDLTLSVCLLRYISALNVGRINPRHLKFDLDLNHKKTELPGFLSQLSQASDIVPLLDQVEPQEDGYSRTAQALRKYLSLAPEVSSEKLPAPEKPVTAGGTYAGMGLLVNKLKVLGDLPQSATLAEGSVKYESDFAEAV